MRHRWTDEEREIVRRDYKGTNASAEFIAYCLSAMTGERVTKYAVKGQVQRLGINTKPDRKPWSPEQDERLAELIGKYAPQRIARMMGRSINSVIVRAKRIGCSRRVRNGWFTKKEVCEILGVDHKLVQRWIDSRQLRASWHNETRPQKSGKSYWHIEEKHLKDFLLRYPTELVGRNVDLVLILDIVAGIRTGGGERCLKLTRVKT